MARHHEVFEHIRQGILTGRFTVGQRIPAEMELSKSFNVSRETVSRAVRALAQDGLLVRRRGAGSFVMRRPLLNGDLFCLVSGANRGVMMRVGDEIALAAQARGFSFLWGKSRITEDSDIIADPNAFCRRYAEHRAIGMFFLPLIVAPEHRSANNRICDAFDRAGIPVVLIDRDICGYPRRSKYDLVEIDNFHAGYTLARHFCNLGRRRIEFVALEYEHVPTADARIAGCRHALLEQGVTPSPGWVHHGNTHKPEVVRGIMRQSRAEAFICVNDDAAAGMIHNLAEMGLRVPDDVAVSGIDDDEWAALLGVPLTTVRQPVSGLALAAVELMLERLAQPGLPPRKVSLTCELVVRDSCGAKRQSRAKANATSS